MGFPHVLGSRQIQQNFDQIKAALGLTKRTRGVANVSTTASATGTATVTHGLGTTPNNVQATSQNTSGAGLAVVGVASLNSTTFDIFIRYSDGVARTLTVIVGWEAIA